MQQSHRVPGFDVLGAHTQQRQTIVDRQELFSCHFHLRAVRQTQAGNRFTHSLNLRIRACCSLGCNQSHTRKYQSVFTSRLWANLTSIAILPASCTSHVAAQRSLTCTMLTLKAKKHKTKREGSSSFLLYINNFPLCTHKSVFLLSLSEFYYGENLPQTHENCISILMERHCKNVQWCCAGFVQIFHHFLCTSLGHRGGEQAKEDSTEETGRRLKKSHKTK